MAVTFDIFAMETDLHAFKSEKAGLAHRGDNNDDCEDIFAIVDDRQEQHLVPDKRHHEGQHQVLASHLDFDNPTSDTFDNPSSDTGNIMMPLFDLDGHVENVVEITGHRKSGNHVSNDEGADDEDIFDLFSNDQDKHQPMDYQGCDGTTALAGDENCESIFDIDVMAPFDFELNPDINPGTTVAAGVKSAGLSKENCCNLVEFSLEDDKVEQGIMYNNTNGAGVVRNNENLCSGMMKLGIEEDLNQSIAKEDCKMLESAEDDDEEGVAYRDSIVCHDIEDMAAPLFELNHKQKDGTEDFKMHEFNVETSDFAVETLEFALKSTKYQIDTPKYSAIKTPEILIELPELSSNTQGYTLETPELPCETQEHDSKEESNSKNVPPISFEKKMYQIGNRESADFPHYNADFISYFSDEGDMNNSKTSTLTSDQQRLTLTPNQQLQNFDSDQDISYELQSSSSYYSDEDEDESYDFSEEVDSRRSEVSESEDSRSEYSELATDQSDMVAGQGYYMGSDASTGPGTSSEMEDDEDDDDDDDGMRDEEDNALDETICVKDDEEQNVPEIEDVVAEIDNVAEIDDVVAEINDVVTEIDDVAEIDEAADEYKDEMNDTVECDGSVYNVLSIQVPSGYKFKYRTLHDLLPGFQKFLDDLCQIKLTSDLEEKAKDYRQRITDYIEQFSSQPGDVPPPLPDPGTFPRDSDPNIDVLIAEERIRSRQHFAGAAQAQFSNTLPITLPNGHSSHGDFEDIPDKLKRQSAPPGFRLSKRLSGHFLSKRRSLIVNQPEEDFYEAPMDQTSSVPPPVPDSERPPVTAPIRQIDDLPCYDDPDSPQMSPPPVTGNPPRLPGPTINQGYHVLNPEAGGHDSGGTFTTSISSCTDDGELYEDVNDNGDFDDSFSDYESDELEVLNPDTDSGVISPSSTKEKKKKKKDDWQNFINFLEAENNTADHTGRLHFYDAKSTLKHIFKPKVYFCAATNARLLAYLPKKEYGKPQFDIQLHAGCEISATGKDSNKEYGIQIQAKKGKTYNFTSSSQMDADKWIETLKKYTNQGLEYDVTHVRTEHSDSVDGDPTSPPAVIEDPMIGKLETLMKKVFKNKKKKHPPQITEEDGVLQGYANVMGALYGEPNWKKKWIVIKNHEFYCHKSKNDEYEFVFSLKEVELAAPEQKIVKKGREGALKFHKDNETLVYFEALNPLDVGKIMKQALNAMMVSSTASKSSIVRRETTVEKITKFYEALETGVNEQPRGSVDVDDLYVNTKVGNGGGKSSSTPTSPTTSDSTATTPEVSGVQDNRLYVNTQVGGGGKLRKLSHPAIPVKVESSDDIYEDTAAPSQDDIYEDTANPPQSPDGDNIYDDTAILESAPPPLPDPRKAKSKSLLRTNKDASSNVYGNIKVKNSDDEDEEEMYLEVYGNPNDKQKSNSTPTTPLSPSANDLLKKASALFSNSPKTDANDNEMYLEVLGAAPSNKHPDDKSPVENKYGTLPRSKKAVLRKASSLLGAVPFTRRKKDSQNEKDAEEEVAVEEEPKKDKKKKKDKKDKKKKKGKKDEIEHPDEPPPDPPQSYDTPQPTTKPVLSRTLSRNDSVQRPKEPPPGPPQSDNPRPPAELPQSAGPKPPADLPQSADPKPPAELPQSADSKPPADLPVDNDAPSPNGALTKENKFKDSDKKHLLDADRLQGDKKDVENRKKELTELKKDIQNKRKSVNDSAEKTHLDEQFKSVQAEWSQCSKRLAELEEEIERATKATVPQLGLRPVSENGAQLMKNSPASLRRGGSGSRRSSGSSQGAEGGFGLTSPERECATSDMTLQDKIRRFQQK